MTGRVILKRRSFLKNAAAATAGVLFARADKAFARIKPSRKVLCVSGHPDDAESGCGGTLAALVHAGHEVTILYLTTGEAGIAGKSHDEAAAIRQVEAEKASEVLGARPVFLGQIDGSTVFDNEWVEKAVSVFEREKPDLVFTHWPLDSHKDHQVASLLAMQVYNRMKFSMYYFEVCAGMQTTGFHPTDYVDITDTQAQKRRSVFHHVSQKPEDIYGCGHAAMEEFRGREIGAKAGEGFVRHNAGREGGVALAELL